MWTSKSAWSAGANANTVAASIIQNHGAGNGGGGTGTTHYLKQEAEAPFTRFRVVLRGNNVAASDGYVAAGAVTEEPGVDTATKLYVPIVGGAQYNALRSSGTPYGFVKADFTASGGVLPASVTVGDDIGQVPATAIYSDWIYAPSVPPTSGTRPFVLVRVAKLTGSNGTTTFTDSGSNNAWMAAKAANQPFARTIFAAEAAGNGVATPATIPATTAQGGSLWVSVEFDYGTADVAVPVKNVLLQGDSVTADGGYQTYGWDSWGVRACLSASTPTAPIGVMALGLSSRKMVSSLAQTAAFIRAGARPHVIVIPNASINDVFSFDNLSATHIANWRAMIREVVRLAREIGAQVIIWTTYHEKSANPNPTLLLAAHNAWTRSFAATQGIGLMDVVTNWVPATHVGVDGIHPSAAGIVYMQNLLQPMLVS